MVRIRLRRTGLKGQASYRVIIADKESPRDGKFLDIVGHYNPRTEPSTIKLEEAKIYEWMKKGAQPSESVAQIFKSVGLTERFERLKNGEDLDVLVSEAEEIYKKHTSNHKTNPV